jgi:hypothetical protein
MLQAVPRNSRDRDSTQAVGGSQHSAYDCPRYESSGNRCAPSPTSASPLNRVGDARGVFMIARGPPIGAALPALVANKADTKRVRSEVDIVVPFKVGWGDLPQY